VRGEKQLPGFRREIVPRKDLGEVVYKMRAAQGSDALNLLRASALEKNIVAGKAEIREKAFRFQQFERRLPQIHASAVQQGETCFVGDNLQWDAEPGAMPEKNIRAVEQRGGLNARAIDDDLQPRPQPFPVRQESDRLLDLFLVAGDGRLDQPFLAGGEMKEPVITNERVVEVNADDEWKGHTLYFGGGLIFSISVKYCASAA